MQRVERELLVVVPVGVQAEALRRAVAIIGEMHDLRRQHPRFAQNNHAAAAECERQPLGGQGGSRQFGDHRLGRLARCEAIVQPLQRRQIGGLVRVGVCGDQDRRSRRPLRDCPVKVLTSFTASDGPRPSMIGWSARAARG